MARLTFIQLRQVFIKPSILYHFNLKCQIKIETNVSNYAINKVLSQLTTNSSGQWQMVVFNFSKMILVETQYKTHNSKLLAILKAFKTW